MGSQQHHSRVLLWTAAAGGAVAACVLLHKLWLRQQQEAGHDGRLQLLSSSGTWLPQLLLQGCAASPGSSAAQLQLSPVVYDYAQSIEEVLVEAQLPAHIQQQDVSVRFDPSSLLVVVGQQRVIEGRLAGHIMPQRSSWKIEGQGSSRKLSITLCKQRAATGQRYAVWGSLLQQEDTVKPRTQQLDQQSQL